MTDPTQKPKPDPKTLLHLSEHFLRRRLFTDCRKYALQAQQLNPNLPGLLNILAVADVSLATSHHTPTGNIRDWYDVLNIPQFSQDNNLIKQRFNHLYGLLYPGNNKFSLADEAFKVVCDAWHVLSDSVKKVEYDCFLKKILEGEGEGLREDCEYVFWTVCPYCYYVYEYPRDYLDMCVKCVNEECGKGFTCVEIECPPDEVLKEGRYVCDGFVMLGFRNGCWNPFAPVSKWKPDQEPKPNVGVGVGDDRDKFVTISDDEDGEVEGKRDGLRIEKAVGRRKKSVAKNTKKVTGAGNRVRKEAFVDREQLGDCEYF